ncbi:hypothetical protein HAHE_23520 [Haloferula helveola]|uniref:Autotransporter-associated beta strand repeat-containing protein n=1 Tax=Haloferula helveola TaxID=490095 RepID=A0ABN6H7D7_9BACT|nr:hypothetical protein HAHE_23520 [Haloferula helveola]
MRTNPPECTVAALTALALLTGPITAASLYWDGTDTSADADGGDGTWDTATASWDDAPIGGVDSTWNNANNDTAVFGGASGTVTIDVGGVTVGGVEFGTAGYAVTGDPLTFGVAGTITANEDAEIAAVIAGGVGISKDGTGTLTLSGANAHTGGTTINAGAVYFTTPTTMPASGAVTVNTGSTLMVTLGGSGWTTGASGNGTLGGLLAGDGGQAGGTVAYSGDVTLGLETSGNQTYTGVIADVGTTLTLRKTGPNQLSLRGLNTYSGGTILEEGSIEAPAANAGGSDSPLGTGLVTLLPGTTLNLSRSDFPNAIDATDAVIRSGNSFGSGLPGDITVTGTVTLMHNNGSGNIDYNGDISGTGGVISYGNRETQQLSVDLAGNNTFAGPAEVGPGANMGFKNRESLPDTGSWTADNLTVDAGGIAYFYVGGGTEFTTSDIDMISGLGTGSTGFLDGSFLGFWTTSNFTHTGVIADTNGGANKLGIAKHNGAKLTLGSSNTFTGPTLIRKGIIEVDSINSVAGGTASSSLGAPTTVEDGKIFFCGSYSDSTLRYVGTGETTDRIIVLNTFAGGQDDIFIDQVGTGLLTFTSDMEYTANGKRIILQGTGEGEFSGRLGGKTNAKLEKSGSGTWTVSGANLHYGITQLNSGVLKLTAPIGNGGLAPTVNTTNGSPDIVVSDATGLEVGMTVSSSRVPEGSTIVGIAGTTITLDNNATGNANGQASGIGYPNALGLSSSDPANLYWNNSATLEYSGADDTTDRGFSVANGDTATWSVAGGTVLTVTGDTTATTGKVAKSGAGTLALGGTLLHTGTPNSVDEGTLLINGDGTAMTGDVEVNNTATLGGTGIIGGNVKVGSDANVAPGASAGTLTVLGDFDLFDMSSGAGVVEFELDAIGASDQIAVTGQLGLGSGTLEFDDFTFTDLGGLENGTYVLITSGGIFAGDSLGASLAGPVGSGTGTLALNGNDLELTVTGIGGGGTPYETWATGGELFEDDENGDGVFNGLAFLLGVADPYANATGALPQPGVEPGFLTLSFERIDGFAPAVLSVEYGSDLSFGNTDVIPLTSQTLGSGVEVVVVDGSPTDTVTIKIPDSFAGGGATLFARLSATEN